MYLGLDIGTSSVKCLLIDEDQQPIASHSVALEVQRPRPGFSEQDPQSWWQATLDAVDALKADHAGALGAVRGIGLSGQMHGATLLDAADRPLRPAILWNDGRSEAQCAELERACPRSRAIAGNIAMPGFTAPKLLWVREHEPEVFARTAKVLLPKDYVRLRLAGEYASDMSDAAGTLWLDVGARRWSPDLLAACALNEDHMPALHEGVAATGTLRRELGERWGMAHAPVVAGGAGDNAATACGLGTLAPGSAFLSLGTSGVLFVANERFAPNTEGAVHAFCHAVPGRWHQMGVMLSATDCLNWLAGVLGAPVPELVAGLPRATAAESGVLFLPYLSGERTPHNDAGARGVLLGLGHASDRGTLVRAVLEGVAFGFRDCLRVLRDAGTEVDTCLVAGGGARSREWLQIIASCTGVRLQVPASGDFGAAFGAARLGALAATGADPESVCTVPPIAATIEPEAARAGVYAAGYERYRTAYPLSRKALP